VGDQRGTGNPLMPLALEEAKIHLSNLVAGHIISLYGDFRRI
jgi:hypothetical protein